MKVDLAISNRVLNRIKGSSERLVDSINQQGEDRCYKGDPLTQLVERQQVPASVANAPMLDSVVIREMAEVPVEASTPIPHFPQRIAQPDSPQISDTPPFSELDQLEPLYIEMEQLRKEGKGVHRVLDEVRQEVGKLVANSRREMTRFGKRLVAVEERALEPPTQAGQIEASPLQREQEQKWVELNQKMEQLQRNVTHATERMEQLSLRLEREQRETGSGEDARWAKMERAIAEVQQRLSAERDTPQSPVDEGQLPRLQEQLKRLQQVVQGVEQRIQVAPEIPMEQWRALKQKITEIELKSEQATETQGAAVTEQQLQQLEGRLDQYVTTEQNRAITLQSQELQSQVQELKQQLDVVRSELKPKQKERSAVEVADPLSASDGREKSIVQELRYEIGEVKKSNSRQLDAMNSKLHTAATSSEVGQIVKHATAQMQHRIDELKQQLEQLRSEKAPVSTAIRF